ncbi:hypothetical protein PI125_g1620 [Phytophthora idaei]|nr:hypothetical protein PI125_g1620 [Phytophthora idaei]KAG3170564.1 hypothetical protein PI126_g2286 [Phytophthora idaei]
MAEDLSVTAVSGRKHPGAPTQQMQEQLLPPDASALSTFASESPVQPPQQSDGLARTAASSTSGLPLGRRMRLTLGQKREVVDLAASKKFTHRELAEKFRVGRTTITNICRQEDLIRTETDSADATKKKRKTTKCTYDLRVLDECLHKWRMEVKVSSPDTKLTGTVLQHKAMELACKIVQEPYAALPDKVKQALQKFSGSNGWLDGYRTSSPSPALLYRELQHQLTSIAQLAPDFLRWIGVTEPANAQAFVDLEGNASVTDPGIDEVQIIRGVLQKHGYLSTKRLDDESHANGPYETFEDVADEPCPRPEEVLASIGILKRYLRLSRDAIPSRVDAIVQLNQVKRAVDAAAFRDAAI